MDTQTALRTRRTVHAFKRDPVPVDVVRRAIDAAVMAPNHKLTEPWRFTLLGRAARAPLADLAVRVRAERFGYEPEPDIVERIHGKILDPPFALVVTRIPCDDPLRDAEDRSAVACALQNLFLSLHAEGVGSKWSTGAVVRDERFFDAVGVDPEGGSIEGVVWIGYASGEPKPPARSPRSAVYEERLDA